METLISLHESLSLTSSPFKNDDLILPPSMDHDLTQRDDDWPGFSAQSTRTRHRRKKRNNSPEIPQPRCTPERIAGRIGKRRSDLERRDRWRQRKTVQSTTDASPEGPRRVLSSRQFLTRRKANAITRWRDFNYLTVPLEMDEVWESILAIPGFSFAESPHLLASWTRSQTVVIRYLRDLLAHPLAISKCGRSLARRRLPNLLVMILTFPITAHHGRGVFEQNCGYVLDDENSPAFWARFSSAFGSWLLADSAVTDENSSNKGLDWESSINSSGTAMCEVVTFFSSARARYLNEFQNAKREGVKTSELTGGIDEVVHLVTKLKVNDQKVSVDSHSESKKTPTPQQRRVSLAADAWLLFLDKAHAADFDLEILSELTI